MQNGHVFPHISESHFDASVQKAVPLNFLTWWCNDPVDKNF